MTHSSAEGVTDDRARSAIPRRAELRRSLRFVTAAWFFGSVWFASLSGAPITLFAKSLGASEIHFGILTAIPFIAALLSSPSSIYIDKTGKRRPVFFIGTYVQRILWLPISIFPLWILSQWGSSAQPVALYLFLFLMLFMYCGGTVGGPAWQSWMSDLIPQRVRGVYIGRRRSFGMLTLIPASIISGLVLDHVLPRGSTPDPMRTMLWCGYIFIAASCIGVFDVALHHWVPDAPATPHKSSFLGVFKKPLRDPQFLWFAGFVGTITFSVSFMGQFSTLYLLGKLDASNTQTQIIQLAVPSLAQLLVLAGWGRAVDRMGKKPVMALACLGLVPVGFGWCFMSSGSIWLGYLLTAVGEALYCGVEMANSNMILEMAGTDDEDGTTSSSYVAVNAFIVNFAGGLGGISAGLIAQALKNWHYNLMLIGPISYFEVLFALSGVMRLLAVLIFLPRLHEPKAHTTHAVLRFMSANIYNNLFNLVAMPLRAVRKK